MGTLIYCEGEKAIIKDTVWILIFIYVYTITTSLYPPITFYNETLGVIVNSFGLNSSIDPWLRDVPMLHRDIKTSSILLGNNYMVKNN